MRKLKKMKPQWRRRSWLGSSKK
jgi:hypothetical protein